jgi:hypothetical protein
MSVQAVPGTPRRPTPKSKNRPEPVNSVKPLPGLWETALQLAGGDSSKITLISAARVEIRG